MRRLLIALAVAGIVMLPAAPAWAHNQLAGSDPAAGAVLTRAPASVSLRFLQRLDPLYTTIVVSDANRRTLPATAPVIDGGSGTITLTGAPPNGSYTVAYRVVSVDGHAVQGSYGFTLADPSLPAAVTAPPVREKRSSPLLWWAAAAAGVAAAVGAGWVIARRASTSARSSGARPATSSPPPPETSSSP